MENEEATSRGKHVVASKGGHWIQLDEPDPVKTHRHQCSGFLGDFVGISIDFDFINRSPGTANSRGNGLVSYAAAPLAVTDCSWLVGLLQPPIGVTRSTSRGPQLFV
jgi:hypothetical protein